MGTGTGNNRVTAVMTTRVTKKMTTTVTGLGLRLAIVAVAFVFLALAALAWGPQAAHAAPALGPALGAPPAQQEPVAQQDAATPEIPMTLEEKQGCGCHSPERESWQMSPHGQMTAEGEPVAACTTCHGEYVEGHPEKGMIPLATDSSACTNCHKQTAEEWQGTVHAEAGIQCISCHLSHTQDLRVTSDQLCETCHRDSVQDPLHTAHWLGEAGCTSCHMAGGTAAAPHAAGQSVASSDPGAAVEALMPNAPQHDFVSVSSAKCLDCHSKDVTVLDGPIQTGYVVRNDLMQAANQVPALQAELASAQQVNRALSLWQPVSLGSGIGIGGILGIAFVLVVVRLNRPKRNNAAAESPDDNGDTGVGSEGGAQ